MKTILNKILEGMLVIVGIFTLGVTPSMTISVFVCIFTKTTMLDCVTFAPFWLLSLLSWIIAGVYINESVRDC